MDKWQAIPRTDVYQVLGCHIVSLGHNMLALMTSNLIYNPFQSNDADYHIGWKFNPDKRQTSNIGAP